MMTRISNKIRCLLTSDKLLFLPPRSAFTILCLLSVRMSNDPKANANPNPKTKCLNKQVTGDDLSRAHPRDALGRRTLAPAASNAHRPRGRRPSALESAIGFGTPKASEKRRDVSNVRLRDRPARRVRSLARGSATGRRRGAWHERDPQKPHDLSSDANTR